MTREELIALRKTLGLTQAEMAAEMGLGRRAYVSIETGEAGLRSVHENAAQFVAIKLSVANDDDMRRQLHKLLSPSRSTPAFKAWLEARSKGKT